uniref:Uncharacterized protein n=1 Tax=Rhodopseudomonas palustris (strain BisA53) TaxID=316055 RepID=Q07N31_RHOP5
MNDTDFASLADGNAKILLSGEQQQDQLNAIISSNDVVFGLFPDQATQTGWDKHLIKGNGVLTLIAAGNKKFSAHHKVTAIWCKAIGEAQALERAYGDDRG